MQQVSIGLSSNSFPSSSTRLVKEMGLFEKHGLDVKIVPMDNASVASMGLLSGSVDFTAAGPSDVVIAQAKEQPVVVVANLYHGFSGVLVVRKTVAEKLRTSASAPVAERLKALDGLTIAAPSATATSLLTLQSSAQTAGSKPKYVYMSQPAMVTALKAGAIDGFIASSPFYASSVIEGSGVVWLNGPKGDFPAESMPPSTVTLNAKSQFIREHPDVIKRVNAAFEEFSSTVAQNPKQVRAAAARVFRDLDAKTLDLICETELASLNTRPFSLDDARREIAFVKSGMANNQMRRALNPQQLLYRE
ncbi:ABC transporter substrate-binding protein [Caballeronia calidae]|nr:ABC transporter substrate-binding protein [Caballeronia calidae]